MHAMPLNFQTLQKVFLGIGCVGLIISCLMTYKFGSTMSWLHAVALCLVTIAAAFIFPAQKLIQDMGLGGKGRAMKAAGVFFVCLELFSHLGYTIGMREKSTLEATVQTAAYQNTQDALASEKTNLAFWREQLKGLQEQNAWTATVTADGLRAQIATADTSIAQETKRGGCGPKCLDLMKNKADLEARIATVEKADDLAKRIEATQRILDGKTETAVAAKSGFSAARAQTDFVSQLYLIVTGSEAEKALNPDATTLSVTGILIGFFIAVGATALPTTAFYVAFFGVKGKAPQQAGLDVSKLTAIDANLGKVTVGKRFDEGHHMTVNLQDVGEDLRRALKDMANGARASLAVA